MKKIKKKIILTARDFSAANALINFRNLLKNNYDITVYCENPAYNFLRKKFKCNKFVNSKKNLSKIFSKDINIIISGYSSNTLKKYGVDEIFIKEGKKKKILTFVFQDYPGDINFSLKTHPDFYLVVNKIAKKITEKKTKIKSFDVGYAFLKQIKKNRIFPYKPHNKKRILIAGQPLQKEKLNKIYDEISSILKFYKNKIQIFYRPHPTEKLYFKAIKNIFKKNNLSIKLKVNENVYASLYNIDLLISVFSSIVIEYKYMLCFQKRKSIAIYYINDKVLRKKYNEINLYSKINLVKLISNKKQLNKLLFDVVNNNKIMNKSFTINTNKINFGFFKKKLPALIKKYK